MPTIAVKIIDPADQQWAQLLDATEPVRRLIPTLVERLGLPDTPTYELLDRAEDRVLAPADTLQEHGLIGGEELLLRPVKDGILADFLDALYDEAVGFVAARTFDGAIKNLETLYRLDPDYPDKQGLWRKVAKGGATASGGAAASTGRRARKAASRASASTPPSGGGERASRSAARAAGGQGCSMGVILVVVIVFIVAWMTGSLDPFGMPEWPFGPRDNDEIVDDGVVLGTGDVQVTLRWDNDADLDLHVVDPAGAEVYYGNRTVPSGGELDVDAQGACGGEPPVENVFWPSGGAPRGPYVVRVDHFKTCSSSAASNYTVTVRVDGRVVDEQRGQLAPGAPDAEVSRFTR